MANAFQGSRGVEGTCQVSYPREAVTNSVFRDSVGNSPRCLGIEIVDRADLDRRRALAMQRFSEMKKIVVLDSKCS